MLETTEKERLDALRRRAGAPDEANTLVMLGFFRALCRDADTLVARLVGLLSFTGLDTLPCEACAPGRDIEDCPACQARAVLGSDEPAATGTG
jgi:hypothetical protein